MGIITDIIKGLPLTAIQAEKIVNLEARIKQIEAENEQLRGKVTGCPRCRSLNWAVSSCEPDRLFGSLGGNSITWRCPDCGLTKREIQ